MNKYPYFYGIRGVRFIWHGSQCDPELSYKGKVVNYYTVENYWWEEYKEECRELHLAAVEDDFPAWIKSHGPDVKEFIQEL